MEREQQFWAKEIVVKIEYKFCPNLTIIDTPGESSRLSSDTNMRGWTHVRHRKSFRTSAPVATFVTKLVAPVRMHC